MCTRIAYQTGTGSYITGRSMDWAEDTKTDLWAFPRGMAKDGGVGPRSFAWTAKHGSVVSTFYGVAVVDGMNEAGMVANMLYLVESEYPNWETSTKPLLSIGAYTQYVLDMCATAEEVAALHEHLPFDLVAPTLPNGKEASGHLAVTDASGDVTIVEFLGGKPVVHHNREYTVMTNSPTYDQQLAITEYWRTVGGMAFLPGTNRAADRFARMSFLLNASPKYTEPRQALASVFSLMRGISVPLGISDPHAPNISSTLWRTVGDQERMRYYFDSSINPSVFWVELSALDLSEGSGVRKLVVSTDPNLAGDVTSSFVAAEPFKWLSSQK